MSDDKLIKELEELIETWRSTAAQKHPDELDVFNARCDAWNLAADELREVIEEHNND